MQETFEIGHDTQTGVTSLFKMTGSCKAIRIPRKQAKSFLANESGLKVCGVYLLLSDTANGRSVYVGESEPVLKRIKQHLAKPPFDWDEAIIFIGNGGGLTWGKGDIKYMEHGIHQALTKSPVYAVKNGNTPQKSTVVHPAVWDSVIGEIKVLVRFLGHPKLFDSSIEKPIVTKAVKAKPKGLKVEGSYPGFTAIVVRALFDYLFDKKLVTDTDIREFTSQSSHSRYCKGSMKACLLMVPYAQQLNKIGGLVRYYDKQYLHKGKPYALSSQLYVKNLQSFMDLAMSHGLTRNKWAKLCGPKEPEVLDFFSANGV